MPRFPNGTGYLIELRDTVGEPWFSAVCDYALSSSGQNPGQQQLEDLWTYFHGIAPFVPGAAPVAQHPPAPGGMGAAAFLEELSGFHGFKRLSAGLVIRFDRRITLIFGRNGSGKSSVCQALKVLADPQRPLEPLHNVRNNTPGQPSFGYRFRGSPNTTAWNDAAGFGAQAGSIKYFDSSVALRNITGNLEPKAAVEVSVFRLECFDYASKYIEAFQGYCGDRLTREGAQIQARIDVLRQALAGEVDITSPPLSSWLASSSSGVRRMVEALPVFDATYEADLNNRNHRLQQARRATSVEGLQSLRAQAELVERLSQQIRQSSGLATSVDVRELQATEKEAYQKTAARDELARAVFPPGVDSRKHHRLIVAASENVALLDASSPITICPLCRQGLGSAAEQQFLNYQRYLTSSLQAEIVALQKPLQEGVGLVERLRTVQLGDYAACTEVLPDGLLNSVSSTISSLKAALPIPGASWSSVDAAEYETQVRALLALQNQVDHAKGELAATIEQGTRSRTALLESIRVAEVEIGRMIAHRAIDRRRREIVDLACECDSHAILLQRVQNYNFSNRKRTLTSVGKSAHNELVLETFQHRLDEEYRKLCGAGLADLGVLLNTRGAQQDVIVTPRVCGEAVERVLSEGEQKVHALAVFMCEAIVAPQRVLVFDDPVNSFDYNYASNFCRRLRDLARQQPRTQIIVLTHNWHFFINLQQVLNRSQLNNALSVQVLEDCATAREYSEDWAALTTEIDGLLQSPNGPDTTEKVHLSGLLRRLIEVLTNRYVFNGQRHQYKAKSQPVSDFPQFTKLVPLTELEASDLRDLYSEFSPTEHDDLRNFYQSKTTQQYRTWYAQIIQIKQAVEARRP